MTDDMQEAVPASADAATASAVAEPTDPPVGQGAAAPEAGSAPLAEGATPERPKNKGGRPRKHPVDPKPEPEPAPAPGIRPLRRGTPLRQAMPNLPLVAAKPFTFDGRRYERGEAFDAQTNEHKIRQLINQRFITFKAA